MRTLWILLLSLFALGELEAQRPGVDSSLSANLVNKELSNYKWKLPRGVSIPALNKEVKRWIVVPQSVEPFLQTLQLLSARIIERNISTNCFVIEIGDQKDIEVLLHSASVRFLQPLTTPPREELLINGFDLGTNRINLVHEKYPSLNGSGLVVSVKENKFDTTDIDFNGRFISTGLSSSIITGHASIMATMIAGGGNSYYLGRGAAWNCRLSSANFAQLLPSSIAFYNQFGISVENHSYGTGIENFYGADAAAYDDLVSKNPFLVHVFSAGNSGTSSGSSGNYSGIPNFANLTGSFKMAKNIITVGATDSFASVELLSSRGPAFDGRVKPELVAFGQDGSSGAAALVSGTAILIQQAFKNQHHDSLPPASLVKAALINGADELGSRGPDFISGFGGLNAKEAVRSVLENRYILSSTTDKSTQTFSVVVPSGARVLKITLAYTDLPAQPNAFKALINDVDLELMEVSTGQIWKPWVLNSAPNKDSLLLPATRKRDSLNNVEQISIDNPAAGDYQVKIYGYSITNASQAYTIVYQVDSMDQFEWNFPMKHDPVFAGNTQVIRWAETFDANGKLEFSGTNGSSWQLVSSNVNLENKYYRWQVPDSFSTGLLRMTINGKSFQSDTFVISKNIQLQVGFNCEDSVLLNWNWINKADHYRLFALSSNFLESVALLTDTFFIFSRNAINSKHFTVAPIQGTAEGISAFTINYETQGVGCYIKSFLAQLNNDKASAQLELGTIFHLKQIEIQRDISTDFLSLQTITNPSQLSFQFDNLALRQGANKFRAKLTLADGRIIYSGIETVYYLGKNDFILYPNPTSVNKGFMVLRKNLDDATMVLSDLYGRMIMRIPLLDVINPIKNITLQRGVYIIAIFDKNGNRKYTQKIVMQ